MKDALLAAGLPTLPFRVFTDPSEAGVWTTYPAIVKGANQHSSLGACRVSAADGRSWRRVSRIAADLRCEALVEPFLDKREFQVPVWGNDPPEALPPSEILFATFTDMRDRLHTMQWNSERESRG